MAPQGQTSSSTATASSSSNAPTESDVYDRQIRLWGAEAQEKMSSAKVLYINTTGISSEILKNLVLAGVHASIADGRLYPDAMIDTPSSFLPPSERYASSSKSCDIGEQQEPESKTLKKMTVAQAMAPHVHELNPLLDECDIVEETNVESLSVDFLKRFNVIVASKISLKEAKYIAKCANENKSTSFYLVHSFGFYACALIDLGSGHQFRKEIGKELSDIKTVKDYISLNDLIELKLDMVRDRWHKNGPPIIYTKYRCILNYYENKKEWPNENNTSEFVTLTKEFLSEQGLKEDYVGDDAELTTLCLTANAEVCPVCCCHGWNSGE